MHTFISTFIRDIDQLSDQYAQLYGKLSAQELNLKSSPEVWSPAQILQHLIIINRSFFPIIEQAKHGKPKLPWLSKIPFVYKKLSKVILKSVHPDTLRKSKTFTIWKPSESKVNQNILADYLQHHDELKEIAHSTSDLILQNRLIHSPANRFIVYPLSTAYRMMVLHERRHYIQARQTIENNAKLRAIP